MLDNWLAIWKKIKLDQLFTPYTKINLKSISVKNKTMQVLGEKDGWIPL